MKIKNTLTILFFALLAPGLMAQDFTSVTASTQNESANRTIDGKTQTGWTLTAKDLATEQHLMYALAMPGDINRVHIQAKGLNAATIGRLISIYITFDPMNLGEPVNFQTEGSGTYTLSFPAKYGAHLRIQFAANVQKNAITIGQVGIEYDKNRQTSHAGDHSKQMPWMNAHRPVEERVDLLLAAMTVEEKMELLREGWGIPGIPHLGIPDIKKVEAIHGFSYGSGATVFPQSLGMGATFNRRLTQKVAATIASETKSAHAIQAWSPVLDVAQDPRWGRCEETYGEDPVLVTEIGGAWIKGYQSEGLMTTPKHFGGHGATLGGRDSHDIGLSEREWREVHLVPFREVFRRHQYQSIMMSYSDYQGNPVAKSKELLQNILRQEWGFDGYIVSDCGAIGNLTSRKHYTAINKVEAAKQSLAAGIATNCGDTYNDKEVIQAAVRGEIPIEDIDFTCRTLLRVMFRMGLFEENPCRPLDWDKQYPGWNSDPHKAIARQAARESIVLLENKNQQLPLSKALKSIAVIGPGADDLQPGDYTGRVLPGQLQTVLAGIKAAVSPATKVIYEKGCDFFYTENSNIPRAVKAAQQAEVAVLVLGDCTNSESLSGLKKTSGENHDLATLVLPGDQQKLLEAVCATGKPVILVLQAGRPYAIPYAKENCKAILVNWLPGQEGGHATADVLFGDYNPAGRLPMTFPQHVGQIPHYYNFKTSGRRYEYSDLEFYPLYSFGYGLSYTRFEYKNLLTSIQPDGRITIQVDVTNTGTVAGDEVVQLYITDMYASVKTRVTELKDFDRLVGLQPGETKRVNFTISPYQISLLNDRMDRVVEKGQFKIMVGGTSPAYKANDRIKDSLGYPDASQGLTTTLDYPYDFSADFHYRVAAVHKDPLTHATTVTLQVSNTGNLTDTGKVSLYVDDHRQGDDQHFELDPGESCQLRFKFDRIPHNESPKVMFVGKYKTVSL